MGEVTTATIATIKKKQFQPPFGPSVDSLCHPCITTTHPSYSVLFLKFPPPPCAALLAIEHNHGAWLIHLLVIIFFWTWTFFSIGILDYQGVHISADKLLSASWSSGFSWDFGGQNMSAEWFGLLKFASFMNFYLNLPWIYWFLILMFPCCPILSPELGTLGMCRLSPRLWRRCECKPRCSHLPFLRKPKMLQPETGLPRNPCMVRFWWWFGRGIYWDLYGFMIFLLWLGTVRIYRTWMIAGMIFLLVDSMGLSFRRASIVIQEGFMSVFLGSIWISIHRFWLICWVLTVFTKHGVSENPTSALCGMTLRAHWLERPINFQPNVFLIEKC